MIQEIELIELAVTNDRLVELTICPELEEKFQEVFEIEMLQGTRTVLPDGMLYFRMEVELEKGVRLRNWLIRNW